MDTKNKTGWFEDDGIWYLYHKGKILANFFLSEYQSPPVAMYDINVAKRYTEKVKLNTGLVDEAKAVIENMIISYAAERVAEWSEIRYTAVKAAGERTDKHDIEM